MGYSLQYCLNECGNAVPGNECDWEDGVCDACRERREDEAKGEPMTGWTKADTEALRGFAIDREGGTDAERMIFRAAAHIEALEARVAELQRDLLAKLMEPVPMLRLDDGMAQLLRARERIDTLEAERANAIPRAEDPTDD